MDEDFILSGLISIFINKEKILDYMMIIPTLVRKLYNRMGFFLCWSYVPCAIIFSSARLYSPTQMKKKVI